MNLQEFKNSMTNTAPPAGLSVALQALWYAGKDDWDASHRLVQGQEGHQAADWVHAYLHRKEGDIPNANYWYNRAGQTVPEQSLEVEWKAIVAALLA